MRLPSAFCWIRFLAACCFLTACGTTQSDITLTPQKLPSSQPSEAAQAASISDENTLDMDWTERSITSEELLEISRKDPSLIFTVCKEILSRLNVRAPYHISEDIRSGRKLKVPVDFAAYKDWTPLPQTLSNPVNLSKFILVTKDVAFLGWYEGGKLKGDAPVCLGKPGETTESGLFKVLEKDADHHSRSYRNDYGKPAWMPWALRIYDHVWIHAGDITSAYCSHGCLILPLDVAEKLYNWAEPGTAVLILESLKDLEKGVLKVEG